jgi:hypothetical protein
MKYRVIYYKWLSDEQRVEKGVVLDSQAAFRKGRGTMGNVYILDHLVKSELKKKEEKWWGTWESMWERKQNWKRMLRRRKWCSTREKGIVRRTSGSGKKAR